MIGNGLKNQVLTHFCQFMDAPQPAVTPPAKMAQKELLTSAVHLLNSSTLYWNLK